MRGVEEVGDAVGKRGTEDGGAGKVAGVGVTGADEEG